MKPGSRTLRVAESSPGAARAPADDADDAHFSTDPSPEDVLCDAVVRADRVVDGFAFETYAVGGGDVTDAITSSYDFLSREDIRYLLVSSIAPAWFNLVNIDRLAAALGRPVLSVSFKESGRLEPALTERFSSMALDRRLAMCRAAPPRQPIEMNGETVFARAVGYDGDEVAQVTHDFTPTSGHPEPIRVARMTAHAARRFAED